MSILDSHGPALLPGEDHLTLTRDPYYGMVDLGGPGARPQKPETPRAQAFRLQREVNAGIHALDGDEQNRVEVLTGKRLQQRASPPREELPPGVELEPPTVTSLEPNTTPIGVPSFDIHVKGTNFTEGSVIVFNGFDEPTTFVSETELTTGINMDVWTAPSAPLPVGVRGEDDALSNTMDFTFTAAEGGAQSANQTGKTAHAGTTATPLGGAPQGKPVASPTQAKKAE